MLGGDERQRDRTGGQPLTEFFLMGGYAAYVWPAYGFAMLVLIALLAQSWRSARRRTAELEELRNSGRPHRARGAKPRLTRATDRSTTGTGFADPAAE
jgi:heme exporter protein D